MKKKTRIDLSKSSAYRQVHRWVSEAFENPETALRLPDRIILLDPATAGKVFNKEKMRLLVEIRQGKGTLSINQLAAALHRAQPAVSRDVTELEQYGILKIKEMDRRRMPFLEKQIAAVSF